MVKLYKDTTVIYTANEVASMLNITNTMLSLLLAKMDVPKLGRFYLINDKVIEDLKNRPGRGRPKKIKTIQKEQ